MMDSFLRSHEPMMYFYEKLLDEINEHVSSLSEEKNPRVYLEYSDYRTNSDGSGNHEMLLMTGDRNIASGLNTYPSGVPFVDAEWVMLENPDIIMRKALKTDAY